MDKILVEVYVPVLEKSYDFFIPLQSQMSDVLELMKRGIADLTGGEYISNEDSFICHKENGAIININKSVVELGLKNGSRLMLI